MTPLIEKLFHVNDHSPRLKERCQHFPRFLKDRYFFADGAFTPADWEKKSVAIVGSRKPSAYGLRFVRELVPLLKGLHCTVLSGGALGIDAEVHATALRHGIPTQAWLVGPIANPSPHSHKDLFEGIKQSPGSGLLVPRYLEPKPGAKPMKSDWLDRNRWLIAAADAMVVVEGNVNSGTWSSAKTGNEYGISVYVLPGSIFSTQSQGTNAMIQRGYGHIVLNVENLVKSLVVDLGGNPYNYRRAQGMCQGGAEAEGHSLGGVSISQTPGLKPVQYNVLESLRNYLNTFGGIELRNTWQVASETRLSVSEILKGLECLAAQGELQRAGDRFERKGSL